MKYYIVGYCSAIGHAALLQGLMTIQGDILSEMYHADTFGDMLNEKVIDIKGIKFSGIYSDSHNQEVQPILILSRGGISDSFDNYKTVDEILDAAVIGRPLYQKISKKSAIINECGVKLNGSIKLNQRLRKNIKRYDLEESQLEAGSNPLYLEIALWFKKPTAAATGICAFDVEIEFDIVEGEIVL